jgi:hypothetical protein
MSCPTCDHTMHAMGCKVTDSTLYWCPRCGTIKPCDGEFVAPVLPERCRKFYAEVTKDTPPWNREILLPAWNRTGIGESIGANR